MSQDKYEIDGPDVCSQFTIALVGTVAEATERAQYTLRLLRRIMTPTGSLMSRTLIAILFLFLLIGTNMATPENWKGTSKHLSHQKQIPWPPIVW